LFSGFLFHVHAGFGQPDSLVAGNVAEEKVPVVPFRDTLFYINTGIGSFSRAERAASVAEKIRTAGRDNTFHRDSIVIADSDDIINIVFRNTVIMGITRADARAVGKSQLAAAHEYMKIIGDAIDEHKHKTGWLYIMFRAAMVALVITGLYFLIKLSNRLFRRIATNVEKQKGKKIKPVRVMSLHVIDEEKAARLILSCIRIARYAVAGILIYFSLPLMFSIFPPTRGIADKLFGYVLNPVQKIITGIAGYIPNLITIIVIVFVFRYLIKGLRYFAEEIDKGRITINGFYPDWAYPSFGIVKTLLYTFMFIIIFPYLPGSESKVFQGVSVFIGVVLSLGSTSVIGNVVSGFALTYMRPFNVGDWIKTGDVEGKVIEKTHFVTRIRTWTNEEITVPNSTIMAGQTFNYSHSAKLYGLIIREDITFGYDVAWQRVHNLLLAAASRTAGVLDMPEPFVLQKTLGEFYATYQINAYISDADRKIYIHSELIENIQTVFNEAGLELVVPHYTSHRDGGATVLPPERLPSDYRSPLFNIKVTRADTGNDSGK
jgi:small-conductance mechanosensitive channel